jgi:DNA-binding NarL/FixJ family response regulator
VLVVDDHRAFSEALGMALDTQRDLELIGTASTVAGALELVDEHQPDVVLMDVQLPDGDGISCTREIKRRWPRTRVVVLTASTEIDLMAAAAGAGASGFLLKNSSVSDVLSAIRAVGDGGMLIEQASIQAIVDHLKDSGDKSGDGARSSDLVPRLTPREDDVLQLLARGKDTRAVAAELGITVNTCRGYIKNLLAKLGAHSQLEVVVRAVQMGLLDRPA